MAGRGMQGPRRLVPTLLVASAALSCDIGVGTDGSSEHLVLQRYAPPTIYVAWWAQIRECSGLTGSFGDLRFFTVASPVTLRGTQFPCGEGMMCNGVWDAPHDITLAPAYVESERLVKHEMLHDLIGRPGHPAVFDECRVQWPGADGTGGGGRTGR